ncbi:UDP-Glycosyltransferase/glycogen phosphorylase [Gloeophyllum trabeum ATCC 11539]|uniref:Sterol 3-beta-glucosyltransferase n=1 Tax=Gloeophyllum trabeum (strain ATCC 11539 / FP-39264 / Madison 617) TaxID=670483 RepID=S7QNI4_GLOTA|nr:UDP-Glycosyltransferase/glycogen phosphorylase [Gloeophyllum trabeum ATCC 11539]EPQ61096.1 UDP-Glycosyltransferase/glycogen phosphorylase [Gloeophyllum trabeum ATCC 11539]
MSTPEDSVLAEKDDELSTSKGLVQRAVDRLGRAKSIGSRTPSSTQSAVSVAPRRLFSLHRKGKSREESSGLTLGMSEGDLRGPQSPPLTPQGGPSDDSPFIRPPSPPPTSRLSRSMFQLFRGDGSIRGGTHAIIQALGAIPFTEDQETDDDLGNHHPTQVESDSEPDENTDTPMTSSLHTIHRPLDKSRRGATALRNVFSVRSESPEEEKERETLSSSETDDADFEVDTPRMPDYTPAGLTSSPISTPSIHRGRVDGPQSSITRSGSMATVRLQRRARLADKLKDIFDLEGIDEVVAEIPCWLLRTILLQGYMFLTNSHLCFFAHMPSRENQTLKSGSLSKKAQRTKRWIKHWFVLKNDVLSWYQSSSDPYFPHGVVDLRYAISVEPVKDKEFRIRTNQKTVLLAADSPSSRDEWVKAVHKVMFKAQNSGDSVKIAIPYSAIVDVEKSSALDFSETIEVKVIDRDDSVVDSYFFAYFHDLDTALEQIRDVIRKYRTVPQGSSPQPIMDTTTPRLLNVPSQPADQSAERTHSLPVADHLTRAYSAFRLPSIWPVGRTTSAPQQSQSTVDDNEDFTHISKRKSGSSFVPFTTSPKGEKSQLPSADSDGFEGSSHVSSSVSSNHTYPPHPSPSESFHAAGADHTGGLWGVPAWFKVPSKRMFTSSFVSESYPTSTSPSARHGELGFSVLDKPGAAVDADMQEKFRTYFAFDERETLLGYFPGYIYRLLPQPGRLYISTNYFCFKSTGPLSTRLRMILPIRDILAAQKSKAFHFSHYGLILIVKGYEELFFEFRLEERRRAFISLLERQMDVVQSQEGSNPSSPGRSDALILEGFGSRTSLVQTSDSRPPPESMDQSVPAVMFTSSSSTFLTFKPKESLHFTFLTIGSRGDVQPYIALAKGLMADGHRARIATHGEFKEWIEAHGIEFSCVGGDPAELMRICVENGTFTVAFLKEGLLKFRGWLDDLLKTSWEACQGTDVLVESPSAMAGYHIAEALGIPYYRAFTMTWTRTRAYPHAFAVPEHRMGGNYNYMSYVLFDQVFWKAISGQINRWRRNVLRLGGTNLDKMEPHKVPFLYNFSPTVVPPPLDWPEWIHVTGYWFLDDAEVGAKKWSPPPDLLEFIDSAHNAGKKVVYIGFGSIVVSNPKAMTRCVIDAIVKSGVCAILSKGWSDRLQVKNPGEAAEVEEPLPKQIYSIASLPHDWLFKRIDAACHHGGAGTTGASLRAGLPTIIHPFFGDQFFWADRVEALGIGTGVRHLTVEALTAALLAATTDEKQIARARQVGEKIRSENGVATAIEAIYRDLEYARSLVKKPHEEPDGEIATIRDVEPPSSSASGSTPERPSTAQSSVESVDGNASEDWSVISDGGMSDGPHSRPDMRRRSSLGAAVLNVMPNVMRRSSSPVTGNGSGQANLPRCR